MIAYGSIGATHVGVQRAPGGRFRRACQRCGRVMQVKSARQANAEMFICFECKQSDPDYVKMVSA